MELRHALAQVAEIRDHLALTHVFRGYRSATVAFSGVVGLVAALIQAICLPQPTARPDAYLTLWGGAAVINLAIVGFGIWKRARPNYARRTTLFAIEQFLPSLMAGALLTMAIFKNAPEVLWMLPGIWGLLFSLGIFASCRLLPKAVSLAGAWYLVAGSLALAWGQGEAALSPWTMGVMFGIGQLLTALILYVTLERTGERSD